MGWKIFAISAFCLSFSAKASNYDFDIRFSGSCDNSQKHVLKTLSDKGCVCVHRAIYLLDNFPQNVRHFFKKSSVFDLYFDNESFYKSRIRNRYLTCREGSMRYKCVGPCNTENERDAYVLYNILGMPGWTVNYCDEFFTASKTWQSQVVVHEWGRLEGLGRDDGETRENVYHWDTLIDSLCRPETFLKVTGQSLESMAF